MSNRKLFALIAEIAPTAVVIHPESRIVEDLGFDSVALLELLVAIEVEFDVTSISERETRSIRTVAQLETLLAERLRGQG